MPSDNSDENEAVSENDDELDRFMESPYVRVFFDYDLNKRPGDPLKEELIALFENHSDIEITPKRLEFLAATFIRSRNSAYEEFQPRPGKEISKNLERIRRDLLSALSLFSDLSKSTLFDLRIALAAEPEHLANTKSVYKDGLQQPAQNSRSGPIAEDGFERAGEYLNRLMNLEGEGLEAYKALLVLCSNWQHLSTALEVTANRAEVERSIGNKNIAAWKLLGACEEVCSESPEIVNLDDRSMFSTPFLDFAGDVFTLFEIAGDPLEYVRAIKRYEEEIEN